MSRVGLVEIVEIIDKSSPWMSWRIYAGAGWDKENIYNVNRNPVKLYSVQRSSGTLFEEGKSRQKWCTVSWNVFVKLGIKLCKN